MTMAPIAGLPKNPALIVGGYGYRNVGDEAILAGLLRLLGRDDVTVVSRTPAETAARHGARSIGFLGAIPALRHHRSLVIGGGGLFGRDMGLVGRLLPLFGLLAVALGRDVAIVGVGIDTAMPRGVAFLMRALARRATVIVVRDRASADRLAARGVSAAVRPDLSTLAASAGRIAGMRTLRASGLDPRQRPVVGLCLTAVNPALVEPVVAAILGAVDALPSIDFCLVPMSRHPFVAAHNDEVLARRLTALRPRLRLLETDDPSAVLGVFEALSAAVCMRYHSLLFAERAGIPIVPIAYAEKCHHWLAERGLEPIEPSAAALTAEIERAVAAGSSRDAMALERSA
jgi:polysaccharide pyruvyl transferase WcaK-like protein